MKLAEKVIDFLMNPISYTVVIAIFLTSLFLSGFSFLTDEVLNRLQLTNFFYRYGFIVIIVLLFSFFLLVVQSSTMLIKKRKEKRISKLLKMKQEELLKDHDVMSILEELYQKHPNPGLLPIQNQKVKLLEQYEMICKATLQYPIYNMENPMFPFILQPIAEEMIKEYHESNH